MASYTVIVDEKDYTVNVGVNRTLVVETGVQGPVGPSNTVIISDSEPLVAGEGQLWFSDETDVLKVYANGSWQSQSIDDQFF